jgi:hypothetical protein
MQIRIHNTASVIHIFYGPLTCSLDAAGRNTFLRVVPGVVDITVLHVGNVQARHFSVVPENPAEQNYISCVAY